MELNLAAVVADKQRFSCIITSCDDASNITYGMLTLRLTMPYTSSMFKFGAGLEPLAATSVGIELPGGGSMNTPIVNSVGEVVVPMICGSLTPGAETTLVGPDGRNYTCGMIDTIVLVYNVTDLSFVR